MDNSEDVVVEICTESGSTFNHFLKLIFRIILDGLRPLLEEQFDSKAFATRAIQNQVVGETLKKLSQGILGLNEQIRSQVCN